MNRKQALASLKAFITEQPDVIQIIELCRLFPMKKSWRKWTDHQGNYLQVHNNKKVVSFEHHPEEIKDIQITDLFHKAHPQNIANRSYQAFIAIGEDDQNNQVRFVWFLGKDQRLRLVSSENQKWLRNYSPMICGIDTLRPIVRSINTKSLQQVPVLKINGTVAAKINKSWATPWPLLIENPEIKEILGDLYATQ